MAFNFIDELSYFHTHPHPSIFSLKVYNMIKLLFPLILTCMMLGLAGCATENQSH